MEMNTETNLDLFKDAARRMTDFLGTKGVELKNAVALEALTRALGAKNYRTFRALLEKPVGPNLLGWSPGDEEFQVDGVYRDNQQPTSHYVRAQSFFEAAVFGQLRCAADPDASEVTVTSVTDRRDGTSAYNDTPSWDLFDDMLALRTTMEVARSMLAKSPNEAVAAALLLMQVLFGDDEGAEVLNYLSPHEGEVAEPALFRLVAGKQAVELDVVEAIGLVGRYVAADYQKPTYANHDIALQAYQTVGISIYWAPYLRFFVKDAFDEEQTLIDESQLQLLARDPDVSASELAVASSVRALPIPNAFS